MNYKSYFLECGNNSHVNNLIGAKTKDVEGWTQTGLTDGSFAKDGGSYKKSCGNGTLVSNSYLSSGNFEYLQLTLGMDFAVAGALDQFLPNSKDVEEVYWTLVTVILA